ncbi:hypothetical protein ACIBAG_24605 [Streptomyces sp. NPDC051243]|uniref:hypothetical protein n=1 Tax=Streptomyces sp. NPDC051243 TaxID=3365646 RepID=UPI0037A30DA7
MFLVIPAKDDLTVTVVLPTGVRDGDAATAAALAALSRSVLRAPCGSGGTPLPELLAGHGAVADADVGYETLTFRCRMPAATVAVCLPAFLEAVTGPVSGRPDEDATDAPCPAEARLRELLFGDHPLARPLYGPGGTSDLARAHREVMASGTPVVVVAGPDGVVRDALALLRGRLPEPGAAPGGMKREAPSTEFSSVGGVNLRAAAGASRARMVAGGIGVARTEPASAAARVLVELFGPGSASVLRRTLRTDIGIDCDLEAVYEGYQDCGLWWLRLGLDTLWVATVESLVRELLEVTAAGRLDESAVLSARAAACERAAAEASDPPLASYRAALAALDGAGRDEAVRDGAGRDEAVRRLERVTPHHVASAASRVLRTYAVAVV